MFPVSFHRPVAFSVVEPALVEACAMLGAGEALFAGSSWSSCGDNLARPTPRLRVEDVKSRNEPHVMGWQWEEGSNLEQGN